MVTVASIQERLSNYPDATKRVIVFDKYQNISAKDYERMRRASEVVIEYDLFISSHLLRGYAIMKSNLNKRKLDSVIGNINLGESTTVETGDNDAFCHDEADVTMVSFLLETARSGQSVTRLHNDNTDVFVLLTYWVNRTDICCGECICCTLI